MAVTPLYTSREQSVGRWAVISLRLFAAVLVAVLGLWALAPQLGLIPA